MKTRARIQLEGVVQGVGFRPFVHRLSERHGLAGCIANTPSGVEIEVEGDKQAVTAFCRDLRLDPPPLARITGLRAAFFSRLKGYKGFSIRESRRDGAPATLISPDIATCERCREELSDPRDRRYRYPFINCTDCGPRFSIIEAVPYDRRSTTMRDFTMCPRCAGEYASIGDRRYHAQPDACPDCGPQVTLVSKGKRVAAGDEAVRSACRLLRQGSILAVKGVSGFHIACDARDTEAIRRLRARKHRPSKPFALMAADIGEIKKACRVSAQEERLLRGPERPIVLLAKRSFATARLLSPDNNYLGVMLPFSPLHHLLLEGGPRLLVMTSANEADEPVEIDNGRALARLGKICDHFLLHNRTIANRCDDSIAQVVGGRPVLLRRGRGYSPFPFTPGDRFRPTMACGAELKSTFCLCRDTRAFLSQYIGDLATQATFSFYRESAEDLGRMFGVRPEVIACDLHPDYLSTVYAYEWKKKHPAAELVTVQHHEAHAASVAAEHGIREDFIAVCFDGTGYGTDGTVWGGEFFAGNPAKMERVASLEPVTLPGGDKATAEPYRMAISYLYRAFGERAQRLDTGVIRRHRAKVGPLLRVCAQAPLLTSSCGRLFDAAGSLLGIGDIITDEAPAAVRLQAHAERSSTKAAYGFEIAEDRPMRIRCGKMVRQLLADMREGVDRRDCARKFHNGLCRVSVDVCERVRAETGLKVVCLSGGVFQNRLLLESLSAMLARKGFTVYHNELVPPNDGAVSLGQALIANRKLKCA